jgi:hypothetical protein
VNFYIDRLLIPDLEQSRLCSEVIFVHNNFILCMLKMSACKYEGHAITREHIIPILYFKSYTVEPLITNTAREFQFSLLFGVCQATNITVMS